VRQVRILIWILVVLALAGFAFLYLRTPQTERGTQLTVTPASLGGPFTLVGSDGQPFSSSRLAGKPFVIFFGFTHCPDVCPTTLQRLVKLRDELDRGDGAFNIVFVTVDPERDGPKEVASYARAFGGPVIGLTGSPAQIDRVKKRYRIFSQKVPDPDGGYTVDHTASALLFDRQGQFVATIAPGEQDGPALDKLKRVS
jgi:protein SCO1/2